MSRYEGAPSTVRLASQLQISGNIFFYSVWYIIVSIMAPPSVLATFSARFPFETPVLHSNKHKGGKSMSASTLPAGQLRPRSDSDNITVHASLKTGERDPNAGSIAAA